MKNSFNILSVIIVLLLIIIPNFLHSATYTVKSDGSMDYTTITAALSAASNGDTISVFGTITGDGITDTGININKSLTIIGQGAASTIVEAASTYNTADRRVFTINSSFTAVIQDMTIRYGKNTSGGGVRNEGTLTLKNCIIEKNVASSAGGGVNFWGSGLTITDCTIRNNVASIYGGGILISSTGTIITNTTINGNTTGGGIAFDNTGGTCSLSNCTISGNTMVIGYLGAGIFVVHGTMNISNCTITNNVNTGSAGGGIGVNAGAAINMKNSIVAGNTNTYFPFPDIFEYDPGTLTSQGYNIVGDVGNTNFSSNTTGDQYGDPNSTTTPNAGATESAVAIDPLLNSLGSYGGPTETHPLQAGSPAIAAIPSPYNGSPSTDQRHAARTATNYSIGAFEYNALIPTLTEWAAIAMGVLLAGLGGWFILRRFA